jgi:hypothetical protein
MDWNPERARVESCERRREPWWLWGPYLSARQWGTVREDYSSDGSAWDYFPFDHARSRAYRWGEDGLLGVSDVTQRLCFAPAFWNETDPILKERLFGLAGPQGNHGEDVKELYYHLDNVPSHAYMKALYKYPQRAFPYDELLRVNRERTRMDPEYELIDTGIFDDDAYFDIFVEYAKHSPTDLSIRVTAINRGSKSAPLHFVPQLWFRNDWSWAPESHVPNIAVSPEQPQMLLARHSEIGEYRLYFAGDGEPLFTENETDAALIFGTPNAGPYVKNGIDRAIVGGERAAVNPALTGTKAAIHYTAMLQPGGTHRFELRLSQEPVDEPFGTIFKATFEDRVDEANRFYAALNPFPTDDERRHIQRAACAGMLWNKQYYNYVVRDWLRGDPLMPPPPPERLHGRNASWIHLYNDDILSMPDNWEYPWYAAWDLAFHTVLFATIDPGFAKRQLVILTREWFMHPNGQLPAYEWAFDDVNPPVHAWAAYRVFQIEHKMYGVADYSFLERVFQKLLMNFTWWVNREDPQGNNVFGGGFLGLDNIGPFDRGAQQPFGTRLNQSDATSWMAIYSLDMMAIALELAQHDPAYEDIASKFFEHFLYIAHALNEMDGPQAGLWNQQDGFFYDQMVLSDGSVFPVQVRSLVGLLPLLAVETIPEQLLDRLPDFARRIKWFIENRPELRSSVACMETTGEEGRRLLAILTPDSLRRLLRPMLDENEFLSPHGIRSLSKYYEAHPYVAHLGTTDLRVDYDPGESRTGLFGGNSNWRGPVWFPVNFSIIEALQTYHFYYGDDLRVEFPTGSGNFATLWEVASDLSERLVKLFTRGPDGRRPFNGVATKLQTDPHFRDLILFYEYFHGDNGAGLGASHQTGWTGLVAKLIQQLAEYEGTGKSPLEWKYQATPTDDTPFIRT